MEILIVGVAVVALMVYVSTKIKKSAASAFEQENIDTAEFSLIKPEGFLNPVDNKAGLEFYAYSKDYGTENTAKFRQSEIKLRVYDGVDLKEVVQSARKSAENVVFEKKESETEIVLKTENSEGDVALEKNYKFIAENNKVYELEVKSLQETGDNYAVRIAEMFESFTVK